MLPLMSAGECNTLDRILQLHEDALIEATIAELPAFVVAQRPRVMFENTGAALGRWLMFGRPPRVEWLELSPLSYDFLASRFGTGDLA